MDKIKHKIFRSRAEKELDGIIDEIDINLANNYKSVAHANREKLARRADELFAAGKLKPETYKQYKVYFEMYSEMMKDYHH